MGITMSGTDGGGVGGGSRTNYKIYYNIMIKN